LLLVLAAVQMLPDFSTFVNDETVAMIGVEAAGRGLDSGETAASINRGSDGVLHGNIMRLLQDENGQVQEAYSISAGLDYPGLGPEHCHWNETGQAGISQRLTMKH
jgi:tryptophan synthase beta chain